MSISLVQYEVKDRVALLTFNRPDRLNAWTHEMEAEYFDLLERAAADPVVRVIVLTGAGRGFCAGADIGLLERTAAAEETELTDPQRFCLPLRIPKPIIAAINGPCAGIGLIHALMCDLRFAAEGAKITTAFARRGLVAEYNMAWLLPRLVGQATALDLLLSGRIILAEEAATLGLVNRVEPVEKLLEHALTYARDLATNCSPWAMAVIKQQVYRFLDTPLPEATSRTVEWMYEGLHVPDLKEGVASFQEKRPPVFNDLPATPDPTLAAVTL
jgi:enoyl-CoA hydratase/carnithine racemase